MTTDTMLKIGDKRKILDDNRLPHDPQIVAAINATEQAVLQSPEVQALRKDAIFLDWLVEQRAYISNGGKSLPGGFQHGYWLTWPDDDITQAGIFATPRDAINAAMEKQP